MDLEVVIANYVWPVIVVVVGFIVKDALIKNDLKHKDRATDKELEGINKRAEESKKALEENKKLIEDNKKELEAKFKTDLDATEKKFEDRFTSFNKMMEFQEKINEAQEAQITTNKENNIRNREKHQNLVEKFDQFANFIMEENKDLKANQTEMTKAIVSLEATLKGIGEIIKLKL